MRAWPAPHVPDLRPLAGAGPAIRLFDARRGDLVLVDPAGTARLYVCGITPYDATHLGHAATFLTFDLLRRAWLDRGLNVHYVQNVTDVDDPLFERADLTGTHWRTLAEATTQVLRDDMQWLSVLPPTDLVSVAESMAQIIAFITRLETDGATYSVDDDLYLSVRSVPSFGDVFALPHDQMVALSAQRGGDPGRPGKRDPLDVLLWRVGGVAPAWDSPWGPGRPGWHVECAAVALARLGEGFDVQGGAADLAFPHHEVCAAAASAADRNYAATYVHAGLVSLDGVAMSKSLGNLVMVSQLRAEGHDAGAVRLALLAQHYRRDWQWTADLLNTAAARLRTWLRAFSRPTGPPAAPTVAAMRAALSNDLDAPSALAAVDAWAAAGGDDRAAPSTINAAATALLGVGSI